MSEPHPEGGTAQRAGSAAGRLTRASRALPPERRRAAVAAVGLFLTLFLPWYQETVIVSATATNLRSASASLTGWAAFSFVEAAVLLVAVGVLVLLFVRAEGRAFHVPGGDGGVIMAAGFWTCVLVLWRMFDKEGTTRHGLYETASGIEWGIFIALGVAALLAYAGSRIKLANQPEPPLPDERPPRRRRAVRAAAAAAGAAAAGVASSRRRQTPAPRPGDDSPRPGRPGTSDDPDWIQLDDRTQPQPGGRARPQPGGRARPRPDDPPRPRPDDPARPRQRHGSGELNFSELDEIEFDDPPEPPTVRRLPDPDDHLSSRLDRPD